MVSNNRRDFVKKISFGALSLTALSWGQKNEHAEQHFADRWQFVGIAIEDVGYHVWGASPIIDDDGKVHLFAARWPKQFKVDPGWRSHSEIAHYVSDNAEGPFKFAGSVLQGTGKNTWDRYGIHNPNVHKVGDTYILFYIANNDYRQPPHPSNQCTGMAVAKSLYGPWQKVNGDGKILKAPDNKAYWNHGARNGIVNPAFLEYNGGFFLYFKSQNAKMGLAISEQVTGPYQQLPFPITKNSVAIEDGYAFVYSEMICLLTTDNHGILKAGGGILWKSYDGINFNEHEPGFHLINEYATHGKIKNPRWHYGPKNKMKFERPQLLIVDNKPAFLYLASGCNIEGGDTTVNYVMRFKS
ncbi:glycoside hydrolase family protein [Niabella insulamsoli]|uniref:glycoside hydrolase family protein n=1 Tax=Niabella insulamsoli TaxID=3144874 RepID=UPI0031FD4E43